MEPAGSRARELIMLAGRPIAHAGIGFIPTTGGIGLPVIHGAGAHFIMAGGFMMTTEAGVGGRTQRGVLHGFCGAVQAIIAAGRRCRRIAFTARAPDLCLTGRQFLRVLILELQQIISRSCLRPMF